MDTGRIATLVVALTLAAPSLARAENIVGYADIIDGDTLRIGGVKIRLAGIDAPERAQTCAGRDGQTYECGRDATAVMLELTRGRNVTCVPKDTDRYHRTVATCSTEAGDLGSAMVRRGWAVDVPRYSNGAYRAEEEAAKREGLGMHAGRFIMPEQWRREHK